MAISRCHRRHTLTNWVETISKETKLCPINFFGTHLGFCREVCKLKKNDRSTVKIDRGLMFSPYLTNISITTYVGPLKPNSNNAGWSVDVKKYHICHSWSTWNLNLGLMFRSYFDDFNHNQMVKFLF